MSDHERQDHDGEHDDDSALGELIAFITDTTTRFAPHGPILESSGAFADEVYDVGGNLDDHNVPWTRLFGLARLTGRVVYSEDDRSLEGTWRRLTEQEAIAFANGERLLDQRSDEDNP